MWNFQVDPEIGQKSTPSAAPNRPLDQPASTSGPTPRLTIQVNVWGNPTETMKKVNQKVDFLMSKWWQDDDWNMVKNGVVKNDGK